MGEVEVAAAVAVVETVGAVTVLSLPEAAVPGAGVEVAVGVEVVVATGVVAMGVGVTTGLVSAGLGVEGA